MAPIPHPILPTPALVDRLIAAERHCMTDWLHAMADVPGNPFGIAIQTFGQATALVCRTIPAQVYNRVFGLIFADGLDRRVFVLHRYYMPTAECWIVGRLKLVALLTNQAMFVAHHQRSYANQDNRVHHYTRGRSQGTPVPVIRDTYADLLL